MGTPIRNVKGTRDLLPPETALWAKVEAIARRVFSTYGYGEIRTPVLEPTELFVRTVGESTDIVGKEMYTFEDKKGRPLCLRPESTAAVARAYIQHSLRDWPTPVKLFYIGPHFRYERPQAGRYRQFSQIGAEVLGDEGPLSDVEVLLMLERFLGELGFQQLVVLLNTVGDQESRERYAQALRRYLEPHREKLGEDSRRRMDSNPLRILDTKVPAERALLEGAPRLFEVLSDESRHHFDTLCQLLDRHGVRYRVEERLVRGLDYYTRTVFEIVSEQLGAQNAILGGGRYDGLIAELGGGKVPGIGFAIGEDRLVEALPANSRLLTKHQGAITVVAVGSVSPAEALALAEELRARGRRCTAELGGRSMRSALKQAGKAGVSHVLLIGDDELAAGTVTVRDMSGGSQETIRRDDLIGHLGEGGEES